MSVCWSRCERMIGESNVPDVRAGRRKGEVVTSFIFHIDLSVIEINVHSAEPKDRNGSEHSPVGYSFRAQTFKAATQSIPRLYILC